MSGKFVVGYDGSNTSHRALQFAIEKAAAQKGSVTIVHVLEWSPYSFLTPQELEERHKRRGEEMERAKDVIMDPILKEMSSKDVELEGEIKYGKVVDVLCDIATQSEADQIVIGRDGQSGISARVFGSVASALVQCAPVPCTIVP